MGKREEDIQACRRAEQCFPFCCFPNKMEDIAVLEYAINVNPQGAKAFYYLGNLYCDRLQFDKAAHLWEESARLDHTYPTVHPNLALAYYNKKKELERVVRELEQAFFLDPTDQGSFPSWTGYIK